MDPVYVWGQCNGCQVGDETDIIIMQPDGWVKIGTCMVFFRFISIQSAWVRPEVVIYPRFTHGLCLDRKFNTPKTGTSNGEIEDNRSLVIVRFDGLISRLFVIDLLKMVIDLLKMVIVDSYVSLLISGLVEDAMGTCSTPVVWCFLRSYTSSAWMMFLERLTYLYF